MKLVFLSFVAATVALGADCVPVEGEIILGRNLASAVRGGTILPADAVFSAAPLPGVRRTISALEISRWAQRHGISDITAADTCFEWPLRSFGPEEAMAAMRSSLPPETEIKIVELSRQGVPAGALVFPRSGLREPAEASNVATPVLWHGFVQYGSHRRYVTWARVLLQVPARRVSAATAIRARDVIRAEQLREETVNLFPGRALQQEDAASFVGRIAVSPIKAGSPVRAPALSAPPDVNKGDLVVLELRTARTVVHAQAEAQSAGRIGDKIRFRNNSSGKVIQGRLVSSLKAEVITVNQGIQKGGSRP